MHRRALTRITKRYNAPIPRTDDNAYRLKESGSFSKLDLKTIFHQIRIVPKDIEKGSF